MTPLSRRSFLQITGLALVAGTLPPSWNALALPGTLYGRVLTPATASSVAGHRTHLLWPDSVVRIIDASAERYRLSEGWVERAAIQPMVPALPNADWSALPCTAEVSGPVAPVRSAGGTDSVLVTRVGHGGVLYALDALHDDDGTATWLAVGTTPDTLLGWTPAHLWQPAQPELPPAGDDRHLYADTTSGMLYALMGDRRVAAAPVSLGERALGQGAIHVSSRQSSAEWSAGTTTFTGLPWALHLSDGRLLTGAYWHNRFGAAEAGPALQVAPAFARWLYGWLPDGAKVIFV